jgi:HD superfamily phosphodiesterase
VEFFKDDTMRRCKSCGHRFLNPGIDFGCASYCKYADQCIGNLPPELIAQKEDLLKDRVAIEMKRYFKQDFKRIGHATRVARYAEQIGKEERGNMAVLLASAYLHDIGIKEAERKYQSTAARYQEEEGPPIAKEILDKLEANDELIKEVCDIIGHHHHPREEETINFKCLYDADLITNLEEKQKDAPLDPEKLKDIIKKSFLTDTGRELAEKTLLK